MNLHNCSFFIEIFLSLHLCTCIVKKLHQDPVRVIALHVKIWVKVAWHTLWWRAVAEIASRLWSVQVCRCPSASWWICDAECASLVVSVVSCLWTRLLQSREVNESCTNKWFNRMCALFSLYVTGSRRIPPNLPSVLLRERKINFCYYSKWKDLVIINNNT